MLHLESRLSVIYPEYGRAMHVGGISPYVCMYVYLFHQNDEAPEKAEAYLAGAYIYMYVYIN